MQELKYALISAGAILHYLKDTEHPNLQHIISMQRLDKNDFLFFTSAEQFNTFETSFAQMF